MEKYSLRTSDYVKNNIIPNMKIHGPNYARGLVSGQKIGIKP
jgi:hypothetical protein